MIRRLRRPRAPVVQRAWLDLVDFDPYNGQEFLQHILGLVTRMKHLTKVALSASVMVVAAQAMAVSAKETDVLLPIPPIDDISHVSGLDVFGRLDVQNATSGAFKHVVSGYVVDGETLLERYRIAQNSDFVNGSGDMNNPSWGRNVAACHSACHQDGGGYC